MTDWDRSDWERDDWAGLEPGRGRDPEDDGERDPSGHLRTDAPPRPGDADEPVLPLPYRSGEIASHRGASTGGLGRWLYERWLYGRWPSLRLPRGKLVFALAFAAAAVVLFFCYYGQARTLLSSSESAGQALQAWDMVHGNPLLRGWTLSDVSFYTTELPEYALVELVHGLNSSTVYVAAALSYTLIVSLGVLVARGAARGREGAVRMLIAAVIMVAPASSTTYLVLSAPDHTGTQAPLLLIWLVLDRKRDRWWVPPVIAVLLTWAQVADTLILFEGAIPLAAIGLMRAYRNRRSAAAWYDLALVAGAGLSAIVAQHILALIRHSGGFKVKAPIAQFASSNQMSEQFWRNAGRVLKVFSADFMGQTAGSGLIGIGVHLVGVALVLAALVVVARRLYTSDDRITGVLAVGLVIILIAYVFGTKSDINEIVGLVPIGAVLAGRALGGPALRAGLAPALAALLIPVLLIVGYNATRRAWPVTPQQRVGTWLAAHHLTYGLAGFWNASAVSVASGNTVEVRPVRVFHDRVVTTLLESSANWYDAQQHDATFVIASNWQNCSGTCLASVQLEKSFGAPSATYHAYGYTILVWDHNLLTHLRTLYWCHGWPWDTTAPPAPGPCITQSGSGTPPYATVTPTPSPSPSPTVTAPSPAASGTLRAHHRRRARRLRPHPHPDGSVSPGI
jgi:hypothetical protein